MASSTRTVKVKFDGDAEGLASAAKKGERELDRFNKSVSKKYRTTGDDAGKGFTQGLKKWFSPSSLGKAGQEGGTVFGSGFLGMLKTPVLGPLLLAALGGAAAVAAPAAGAIAGSGLVLGFGAGLAGLGLVTAAKSKPAKDAWSRTLDEMGSETTRISKPYEKTLVDIAGFTKRTFAKFAPSLEASFKETAPVVTRFVDQVSKGLERLQPAVRPLSEAFNAVLDSLGPAIQGAIGNVSNGLIRLSESVKKNPDGLADLVDGMGSLAEKALDLVAALNNANGKIKDLTGGTSAVEIALGGANTKLARFIGYVKDAVDPLSGLKNGFKAVFGEADKTTDAVGLTGDAVKLYTQGLDQNQVATVLADKGTKGLTTSTDALAASFNKQLAATRASNAEMVKKQNLVLGLSGAEINYQAAIDDATAAQKENGKTLDITTAKGRANRTALDQIASAANTQTGAILESNKGWAAASRSAEASRAAYSRAGQRMGLTKKEADALAASVIAIPPKKDVKVTASGAAAAKTNVDRLANSIRLLPGYKLIRIKYTQTGVNLTTPSGVGRRASGGLTQPNRTYLVGERGPELRTEGSTGGRILSAEETARALAGGGSQPIVVENHIEIGGEVVRVVRTEIKQNNRDLKRAVKAGAR